MKILIIFATLIAICSAGIHNLSNERSINHEVRVVKIYQKGEDDNSDSALVQIYKVYHSKLPEIIPHQQEIKVFKVIKFEKPDQDQHEVKIFKVTQEKELQENKSQHEPIKIIRIYQQESKIQPKKEVKILKIIKPEHIEYEKKSN